MHREGCHWQTCRESCCGVKRFISQRGIRQVQPEQNGCMAVLLGLAGLALASKKEQCFYSARVFRAEGTNGSAHCICQLIWMILYKGVRYEERGPAVCEQSKRVRTVRMIRTLRKLGYRVELLGDPA